MPQPAYKADAPVDTSKMSALDKVLWALTHAAPITGPAVDAAQRTSAEATKAGQFEGAQADPTPAIVDENKRTPYESGTRIRQGFTDAGQGAYNVGQAGLLAINSLVKPATNFFAGLFGQPPDNSPDFASASAMGTPPPESAPSAPAPAPAPAGNQQDLSAIDQLINMLLHADKTDTARHVANTLVNGTPTPGAPAAPQTPTEASTALDSMIQVLAQQSKLPEPTFRERLGHVLVGLAVGYNNAYAGGRGNVGASVASALTGGAVEGQKYNETVSRDRTKVEEQNRRGLQAAAALQSGVVAQEGADRRAGDRNAILQEGIQVQRDAIAQRAALAAAREADPTRRISLALKALELRKQLESAQPYSDVTINTPAGAMKVKDLAPDEQRFAVAAIEAPQRDPVVYGQIYQAVLGELQKDNKLLQLQQYGGDVEKAIKEAVTQNLIVYYKQHPDRIPTRQVANGQLPQPR